MKYLLDSNILIEAKNDLYAFDLCPGFWEWLKGSDAVRSIWRVREEIKEGKDDLARWVAAELPKDYFIEAGSDIQQAYSKVAGHVYSLQLMQPVKDAFLRGADGWLIAAAMVNGVPVVTHEKFNLESKRKIQLPVGAREFNVACIRLAEVLRREKVSFKL